MAQAFIVRTREKDGAIPVSGLYESLKAGLARFGWSYKDELDLRLVQEQIGNGSSLSKQQKEAWDRGRIFLEEVKINDYLIYIEQPKYGESMVVKVIGDYDYVLQNRALDGYDFRSIRPCIYLGALIKSELVDNLVNNLNAPGRIHKVLDLSVQQQLKSIGVWVNY